MMAKRSLGKGLDDVLGVTGLSVDEINSYPGVHRELKSVFTHEVIPGRFQPRKEFNQDALQELSNSIKEKGILQPLVVRKFGKEYELIAGERRWRAAQMAGLQQVPVVICDIDDNSALAFSLIENIQRQDLNPIEEALALKRLIEEFSMTHDEVAKAIGRSRTLVTNMLRLLNLTDPVKDMLISHQLEVGHAKVLLSLQDDQQIAAAKMIISKQMTVRGTEAYIKLLQANSVGNKPLLADNPELLSLEEDLFELLGMETKIQINAKGKGRFVCYFSSLDKLKRVIKRLRKQEGLNDEK